MNSTLAGTSLRSRVLLPIAITGAFAVCFGSWRVRVWAREHFVEAESRRAETLANAACSALEGCPDRHELQRCAQALAAERGVLELVVTAEGRVLASSRGEWLGRAAADVVPDHAGDPLSIARPLESHAGPAQLGLFVDREPALRLADELGLRVALFGAGALLALLGLGFTLLRYVLLRPLGLLEGGLERAVPHDRSRAA